MKNIVLLSDGTGNGAAKKNRTNVWRLYRALDLHRADQIAYYDDGVGSQEFLPLKVLGGAVGWGLERNVKQLYKFLCRTYRHGGPDTPADRIYLFGFSRGAFTVRVLAGLLAECGLYTEYRDEQDLDRAVERNYRAFRSCFKRGYLYRLLRAIAFGRDEPMTSVRPDIEFVGVWDTVDAYGFPMDELTDLWDLFIYPLRFPERELSTRVKRACHAVSIDDERDAFHPVLWNESEEPARAERGEIQPGRIEQVWFAGVHSDVGGGYPMDDLALVTLDWMMSRVEATDPQDQGLHFIRQFREDVSSHCDWNAMQHDSRAGLAAYYSYNPRELEALCNDPVNGVHIAAPKIHRAVFERIKGNVVPYAPTGLPAGYQVVGTRGRAPEFETAVEREQRAAALNHALDVIFWRQWLYAALLTVTAALLASRFFLDWEPAGICRGQACALDPLFELAIGTFPDFAAGWFEGLRQNPGWLYGFIATFLALFLLKLWAWSATQARAMAAWADLKGVGLRLDWTPTVTSKLRGFTREHLQRPIKWVTAGVVFVLILALLGVLAGRGAFYLRSTLGNLCDGSRSLALATGQIVSLEIDQPCFATGLALEAGVTYRFEVTAGDWSDGRHATGPDGFEAASLSPWLPFRRHLSEPWLKLMGRIDGAGKENFVIGKGPTEYTARSSGELFVYVNDAVFGLAPGRYWAWPYFWDTGANKGTANVAVTPLEEGL